MSLPPTPVRIDALPSAYCIFTAVLLIGTYRRSIWAGSPWQALGTSAMGMEWYRYIPLGVTIKDVRAGFYRESGYYGLACGYAGHCSP